MSNVLFAIRSTSVEVLGTVSAVTKTVSYGAIALSDLAGAGAAHAAAYREDTERELALNATERFNLRCDERALANARTRLMIDAEVAKDPKLAAAFNVARANFEAVDQATIAKVKSLAVA